SKVMQPASSGDQAAAMNNSMTMMMPIMMGFMAYQFSAGLALYFLISNLTTIGQYAAMGRADWSALFPWIKKNEVKKPEVVIDVDDDEEDDEDDEPEPVKVVKPSARASAKQHRPKMKR
ncbi:MAG: YidC/Oxa1 family membrane protein insertase, partial [Anaerolineaceae bacterium]|nr:YidC/Oxa1 family membrane protein insertase [Anaerolineaceae bacterium]